MVSARWRSALDPWTRSIARGVWALRWVNRDSGCHHLSVIGLDLERGLEVTSCVAGFATRVVDLLQVSHTATVGVQTHTTELGVRVVMLGIELHRF